MQPLLFPLHNLARKWKGKKRRDGRKRERETEGREKWKGKVVKQGRGKRRKERKGVKRLRREWEKREGEANVKEG